MVEFSCAHIPQHMTSNAITSPDVSRDARNQLRKSPTSKMNANVGKVGDGMKVMASMEMQRQISDLEESKMRWELKKLDFEVANNLGGVELVKKHIATIDTDLRNLKKTKLEHDNAK